MAEKVRLMRTHIRRGAVAVLLSFTLACSVACSADSGGGGGTGEPSAAGGGTGREPGGSGGTPPPSGTAGASDEAGGGPGRASRTRPLTRAELQRALLTQGSVAGYTVRRGPKDALPADATVAADRAECRPIVDAFGSRPKYPRTAYTSASLTKGDLSGTGEGTLSQLLLAAYRVGDAQRWLAELRRAVTVCRGFTAIDGAGDREPLAITPGRNLAVGDASVSFLMRDEAGKDAPVAITVVRTGANTATYLSAGTSGRPEPVARAVADEQHRRMVDAGKVAP